MRDWLDPQTKAILQGVPPTKLAPAGAAGFSLVMLDDGNDPPRTDRAVARIAEQIVRPLLLWRKPPFPTVIVDGLPIEDALFGQFELISCDAISVFLRDEVVAKGFDDYLRNLYVDLRHSHEFEAVTVDIRSVPENEDGDRFLDQFLGIERKDFTAQSTEMPSQAEVARKKARIMSHWAGKIGAVVAFQDA
jgi:hypothetical protein